MIHVLFFVIGCCIGSFLNVVFSRKDWYKGRSKCDECGYTLKWYDLIPIFSFLVLKGRCRKCKTKIDKAHLWCELIMGAAFLVGSLSFCKYGIEFGAVSFAALVSIGVCAIEDLKEQMVYGFILNGSIILTTLVKSAFLLAEQNYLDTMILWSGVLILKLIFIALSLVFYEKIGEGDYDILIVIFILGDLWGMIYAIFYASIIGCIIYLPQILLKKRAKDAPLPFIPLLLMGSICYLLV